MSEPTPSAASPSPRTLALAQSWPFTRYATGETVSMIGSWMQSTAQSWVITGMTKSALMLGVEA